MRYDSKNWKRRPDVFKFEPIFILVICRRKYPWIVSLHSDSLLMEFWSLYLGCYQPNSVFSIFNVLLKIAWYCPFKYRRRVQKVASICLNRAHLPNIRRIFYLQTFFSNYRSCLLWYFWTRLQCRKSKNIAMSCMHISLNRTLLRMFPSWHSTFQVVMYLTCCTCFHLVNLVGHEQGILLNSNGPNWILLTECSSHVWVL